MPEANRSVRRSKPKNEILTVACVCDAYLDALPSRSLSKSHAGKLRAVVLFLYNFAGSEAAESFGPNSLPLLCQTMLTNDLIRRTANSYARIVVSIFKQVVAHELISPHVYQALRGLEPLKIHDRNPVLPVPEAAITAVRNRVSAQVRAMRDLQLATGMRPGEVCAMRKCDSDLSGQVWQYRSATRKTSWRGREHVVYLGPKAQAILKPFLSDRRITSFLFSPAEAETDRLATQHTRRVTPLSCGNRPGSD